jgi:hypothetical protein
MLDSAFIISLTSSAVIARMTGIGWWPYRAT